MSTFRNTNDLKKAALERAGELTDGTSGYEAQSLRFINDAYQSLFAGGSEFDPDMDENWIWAKAKRPIVLTLEPAHTTGTVTLTLGSTVGAFSSAPSESQEGRFLKIEARSEYFVIRSHTAGATAFEIDQLYTEASGTFNYKSIPLDYELSDDLLVINDYNNKFPFRDVAGTPLVATLTAGVYPTADLVTHLKTQLEAVGAQTYTVSFDSVTRKFTIFYDGATFFLDFATGGSLERSVGQLLGYDIQDSSGALTYEAENPINPIYRLFGPMNVFRGIDPSSIFYEGINATYGGFAQDATTAQGSVSSLDLASFLKSQPLSQLTEGTPDRLAELELRDNGILKVRFNRFPSQKTRVVSEYIPVPADLKDNVTSVPLIPRAFRNFLVHAAAYYLMLDKSDNRASTEFQLAQAKLKGLIRHNRATTKLAGANYARLIPRRS